MKKRQMFMMALMLGIILSLSACGTARAASGTQAPAGPGTQASIDTQAAETAAEASTAKKAGPGPDTVSAQEAASAVPAQEEMKSPEAQNGPGELTETQSAQAATTEEAQTMLQMTIGETKVKVNWEDNDSVRALQELCREKPLTIQMSMYGGFEQVGPVGTRLPSNDVQTRTSAGDIVLYSSSQIVVFYGSNSWAYTRLGHIEDKDAAGMTALLGGGDVSITFSMGEAE